MKKTLSEQRFKMIDFLYNLFKSEDAKTEEQYQEYKKKYGDKFKILQKGDRYAVQYEINHPDMRIGGDKILVTTGFIYTLKEAKEWYIRECKNYDFNSLPIREV